jgi:ABC-type glycerol-3-phosphate transport system substrate-binding protein
VPGTPDVSVLLWNKDLFRKAGLDPEKGPTTMQEVYEDATKIRAVRISLCLLSRQAGYVCPRQPPNLDFGITFIPRLEEGEVSSFAGGDVISIPKAAKHPKSAKNSITPGDWHDGDH